VSFFVKAGGAGRNVLIRIQPVGQRTWRSQWGPKEKGTVECARQSWESEGTSKKTKSDLLENFLSKMGGAGKVG